MCGKCQLCPFTQVESRRFLSSRATRESRLQQASSADVQPGDKLAKGNIRSSEVCNACLHMLLPAAPGSIVILLSMKIESTKLCLT